jgi:inosine-uridine nucleoside N-ribohydrolase
LGFFAGRYEEISGFWAPPVHDAVAAPTVIDPGLLGTRRMRVEVVCGISPARGQTICHPLRGPDDAPGTDVGISLDDEAFFELLVAALARYRKPGHYPRENAR